MVFAAFCSMSSAAMGPLRKDPVNPRYFTDGSGRAVYLTGSHIWWDLIDYGSSNPPPPTDYEGYLNFLSTRHHNFFRLWVWENPKGLPSSDSYYLSPMPWARSAVCCEADGGNKFDLNTFNQAYFDRLRTRVLSAQSRGIYVAVMLFNGWSIETKGFSGNPWLTHPLRDINNIQGVMGDVNFDMLGLEVHSLIGTAANGYQKAYVRKVIDTIGDLDNVLFEISNESGAFSTAWQYDMISYIKSYEAGKALQHPVGMTFQWPDGDNATLLASPADWIAPNQDAPNGFNYMTNPPPADGSKVIVADTDHLWGEGGGRDWVWMSFTRGLNPIYMDRYPPNTAAENVRQNMGATLDFANRMNLEKMAPRGDLTSTGFALANPGVEYLVYSKNSGNFSVRLDPGNYDVQWYNPSDNSLSSGGSIAANGDFRFNPPFGGGDAVLYLRSSSTQLTPPPALACPGPAVNAFTGCYFNDTTLSQLVLVRTDSAPLDFNWGLRSPDPAVNPDHFSARWEGRFDFDQRDYTFSATADDGLRLYVDGQLVLDYWLVQGATTYSASVPMTAGTHTIRLEYFEQEGHSAAALSWSPGDAPAYDGTVTRFLSDLTWTAANNGWGPVEKDRSNGEQGSGDGGTLSIRGTTFPKGLGVHAVSSVTYTLGGQCSSFQADIGIDDEVAPLGSVIFQLLADGNKIFESGTLSGISQPQTIKVPILNVNTLQLVVLNGADGINSDHADWAGARVVCSAGSNLD